MLLFVSFQETARAIKFIKWSEFRTQIVGTEFKHADLLTTAEVKTNTTVKQLISFHLQICAIKMKVAAGEAI